MDSYEWKDVICEKDFAHHVASTSQCRMVLKLYLDLISQPTRALYLFLRTNKIQYVDCPVALRKREHFTEEYAKVNPFQKVPAIDHDGFKLAESVAIFRYLVREFPRKVPDHWYPKDSKQRARVDEFLEWQHLNLRLNGTGYFRATYLESMFSGVASNEALVKNFGDGLGVSLQKMEDIMLADGRRFLCGPEISVADLLGACEVEQPSCAGYDVFRGRPMLSAWMTNVRDRLQPFYDHAHVVVNSVAQKLNVDKDLSSSKV